MTSGILALATSQLFPLTELARVDGGYQGRISEDRCQPINGQCKVHSEAKLIVSPCPGRGISAPGTDISSVGPVSPVLVLPSPAQSSMGNYYTWELGAEGEEM